MEKIIKVIKILEENDVCVKPYNGDAKEPNFVTGKIFIINDLPFFLLETVCEDVLEHQEKMITFIQQLKNLKRQS